MVPFSSGNTKKKPARSWSYVTRKTSPQKSEAKTVPNVTVQPANNCYAYLIVSFRFLFVCETIICILRVLSLVIANNYLLLTCIDSEEVAHTANVSYCCRIYRIRKLTHLYILHSRCPHAQLALITFNTFYYWTIFVNLKLPIKMNCCPFKRYVNNSYSDISRLYTPSTSQLVRRAYYKNYIIRF